MHKKWIEIYETPRAILLNKFWKTTTTTQLLLLCLDSHALNFYSPPPPKLFTSTKFNCTQFISRREKFTSVDNKNTTFSAADAAAAPQTNLLQ